MPRSLAFDLDDTNPLAGGIDELWGDDETPQQKNAAEFRKDALR
jgi:hypothetical protein